MNTIEEFRELKEEGFSNYLVNKNGFVVHKDGTVIKSKVNDKIKKVVVVHMKDDNGKWKSRSLYKIQQMTYPEIYGEYTGDRYICDVITADYSRRVYVFSSDGKFIKKYNTINECSEEMGINKKTIYQCCERDIYHYRGFIFRYKFNEDIDKTDFLSSLR